MIFGNFITYEVTIASAGHGELDLSTVVSEGKEVRINPGVAGVRVLFTRAGSVVVADAQDFLLGNEESSYEMGRTFNRISFYNGSGGEAKVSIAVMF